MDLTTITVDDFKNNFFRDFPYLNIWNSVSTYNTDNEVYYSTTDLFYKCLNDSVTSVPTTSADWERITDSIYNYVLNSGITKAFSEAQINFNQSLFANDAQITLAYLYLTAHFLVLDLRRSSQGINSMGEYTVQSQSVGSVNESLYIPDKIANNPLLQLYTKTGYGMKYLNLIMPRLVGNVRYVVGATNA